MKKIFLFGPLTLLLFACNQSKETKHPVQNPDPQPVAVTTVDTATPQLSLNPQQTETVVERDANAPLGSPQNPLKLESGKPIDFSQIFQSNHDTRTFGEKAAAQIDSIALRAQQGETDNMFLYGACYEYGWGVERNYEKALEWYRKAADRGQRNAFGAIGGLYRVGHGVPSDGKQAFEWFRKGAEHRDNNAMLCLGNCYYMGIGVEKDLPKAAYWWKEAADEGNAFAYSQMGDAYYGGLGVEPDLEKAVEYYIKAVEKGVSNAQFRLGVLHYYGQGVEKDTVYSKLLISKARDNGVEQAKQFFEKHFK